MIYYYKLINPTQISNMEGNYRFHTFCRLNPEEHEAYSNHIYLGLLWSHRWRDILASTSQLNTIAIQAKPQHIQQTITVITTIVDISFNHLTFLSLSRMGLCNIEKLYQLRAPNLQVLNLDCNYILNLRTIRKMDFPKLKELDISGNQIKQVELISEINANQGLVVRFGSGYNINFALVNPPNPIDNLMPLLKKQPALSLTIGYYSLGNDYSIQQFNNVLRQAGQIYL